MPSSPDVAGRRLPRATVFGAFLEGWRRVLRAPLVTIGVLAVTFATAAPLAIAMKVSMERHLGSSIEADRTRAGWNQSWALEFSSDTAGIGSTFTHDILGFGGSLAATSHLLEADRLDPALVGAIAVYIILWTFFSGGILDRLARGRPVRPEAFFGACGVYFLRFVRLALPIGLAYWAAFRWLRPWLFTTVYDRWTRDLTTEHEALIFRGVLYLFFVGVLSLISLIADFAKVRIVVEDRRSVIAGLGAAIRFARRRRLRIVGLFLLNVLAAAVIARLWLQTAPAATAPLWLAVLGGELYLLCRVWARLAFIASEVVFFQGELAHATFTDFPEPVWPDSPAAEAIQNLRKG